MDFSLPQLGEGVYEAELLRWLVQPGDTVRRSQPLMEVLTDKANMEVPAPFAGQITALQAEPGQTLKVGQVVLTYGAAASAEVAPVAAPVGAAKPTSVAGNARTLRSTNGTSLPVKAAPSVRWQARKLGIDIGTVHGSGPEGRVLAEDLAGAAEPATPVGPRPAAQEPGTDYGTPGTRVKLQGLRRKIAERMVQAKQTIPHYTYVDECDVTELVRLRAGLRDAAEQVGVKVTYLAFVVKAVAAALREVPIVNASLDEASGEVVLHDRYDIGIAVATPGGLIVPVLRDVDKKDVFQIARDIERLSSAARAGRSKLEDLRGGTFTVTSIGNVGGLFATPIINAPEVGILGVGKIVKRPVFDEHGQIRAADLVYLSLSFDHRVLDGAVGATFGNAVMRRLQNPAALLVPPVVQA